MSRSVENEYLLAMTKQTAGPHEVNEKGIISDDDSSEIGYSVEDNSNEEKAASSQKRKTEPLSQDGLPGYSA